MYEPSARPPTLTGRSWPVAELLARVRRCQEILRHPRSAAV